MLKDLYGKEVVLYDGSGSAIQKGILLFIENNIACIENESGMDLYPLYNTINRIRIIKPKNSTEPSRAVEKANAPKNKQKKNTTAPQKNQSKEAPTEKNSKKESNSLKPSVEQNTNTDTPVRFLPDPKVIHRFNKKEAVS